MFKMLDIYTCPCAPRREECRRGDSRMWTEKRITSIEIPRSVNSKVCYGDASISSAGDLLEK